MKSFILLFIFSTSLSAEPLSMFFDVTKGHLARKGSAEPGFLTGSLVARNVKIDFGAEKFEVEKPGVQTVAADLEWHEAKHTLAVKKDGLKFSTPIPEGLGLTDAENIVLREAQVRLDKRGVLMKGDFLSFEHKTFIADFQKAHIFCPTYGTMSTEIDVVCLRESSSEVGVISFRQRALDADFISSRAEIVPAQFNLRAHKARFNDESETTRVDGIEIECANFNGDGEGLQVDAYSVLKGCLFQGTMAMEQMDIDGDSLREAFEEVWPEVEKAHPELKGKKGLIDLDNIKDAWVSVKKGQLEFEAKIKAIFRVKVRVKGTVVLDEKNSELLFRIKRATIFGIPTGKLAYRLIEKFGREDFIEIRGDVIAFKI